MRVYLSSTYQDLIEERHGTLEAIRRLEHHAVGMEDYGATEQLPVEKCVRDVKSCGAYVGILAWRYGFVPDHPSGKSITELEYEAAGEVGIPRLMFLSPDLQQWGGRAQDPHPERILAFRQRVRDKHVIAPFRDADDLRFKVGTDLSREIGRGKPISDLLPFLCDRGPQQMRLGKIVGQTEAGKPLCCILHGRESQCHDRFIECLKQRYVAELSGRPAGEVCVRGFDLQWPKDESPEGFTEEFTYWLGQKTCGRPGAPLEEIARHLSDLRTPVVFSIRLPIRKWTSRSADLMKAFVQFWLEWPRALQCQPTLVVLYVEYQQTPEGFFARLTNRGVHQRNQTIAQSLQQLAEEHRHQPCFVMLPELGDIEFDDVDQWRKMPEVRPLCAAAEIQDRIRDIFARQDAVPMGPLAKQLLELLQEYDTRGAKP